MNSVARRATHRYLPSCSLGASAVEHVSDSEVLVLADSDSEARRPTGTVQRQLCSEPAVPRRLTILINGLDRDSPGRT
jgi:hypothetical protein